MLYTIEMTLGSRIKAARKRLMPEPTQKDIGDEFDVTSQAVSEWERDQAIPELTKLVRLAQLLKVPVAWLLAGEGDPPPPDHADVVMEALTERERTLAIELAKTIIAERGRVA